MAAGVADKLGAHGLQVVGNLLARTRYVAGAQAFGDQGDLGVVGILIGDRQVRVAVAHVCCQEAADLSYMHPGQQVWIAGSIRPAIGGATDHLQVNGAYFFDQPVGILSRAEGGAGDELAGAAQAAEQVLAKVGVIPHAGQRQRVQQLQEQGTDAADQHAGEVAMHAPADAARAEQPRVTLGVFQVKLSQGQAGQAHHLGFDTAANRFHGYLVCKAAKQRCRLSVQAFVDQALDHARIGQGRGIAEAVELVAGDLAQNAPHDLA
ncbi:hypothetical protein D9M71_362030 [compost metagenome]